MKNRFQIQAIFSFKMLIQNLKIFEIWNSFERILEHYLKIVNSAHRCTLAYKYRPTFIGLFCDPFSDLISTVLKINEQIDDNLSCNSLREKS